MPKHIYTQALNHAVVMLVEAIHQEYMPQLMQAHEDLRTAEADTSPAAAQLVRAAKAKIEDLENAQIAEGYDALTGFGQRIGARLMFNRMAMIMAAGSAADLAKVAAAMLDDDALDAILANLARSSPLILSTDRPAAAGE